MGSKTMQHRAGTPQNAPGHDTVNANDLGVISTPKGREQTARAVAAGLIPPPIESAAYWDTLRTGHERDYRATSGGARPDSDGGRPAPFKITEGGGR